MRNTLRLILLAALALPACAPLPPAQLPPPLATSTPATVGTAAPTPDYAATPLPTREPFGVGNVLPYITQSGDTVLGLAAHFNTTAEEILALNPGLPLTATLATGQALSLPAYWFALGGSPYVMLPDSEVVYGPTTVGFDIDAYVAAQSGYLKTLAGFVAQRNRTAAQTVLYVARQYSINPRLLLALMEWRTGALSQAEVNSDVRANPFGPLPVRGFVTQLIWVAERLSEGYYGWRTGRLTSLLLADSTTSRPDFYQTAGSVAVQYLFAHWMGLDEFNAAISPGGFGAAYIAVWGNPFAGPPTEVIPGNLTQPPLALPFAPGQVWSFTGGPHPVWGDSTPWGALDFAPAGVHGCDNTERYALAVAPGVIVRADDNTVVLDLDGDGYEQTGWTIFYFHLLSDGMMAAGSVVATGAPLGHPSCEGGRATGTHVHMARKYNGEWLPADGLLPGIVPFDLGGWVAQSTGTAYHGRMMRLGAWVEACTCSTAQNTVYWAK
ncbi:MAG: LysM peptidoglycan-binding domain-containing protein [Anaerolineales bacterium]|nr:LysM peptidoglycan-binding domain-containing protein [Anaerolineales bacterium]